LALSREPSHVHVSSYVRRLILEGHLAPGARVPQIEIAQTLGVSRIPVREALIALQGEGWVSIEFRHGAYVNALDERSLSDQCRLLAVMLGFAADKAIERGGVELGCRLRRIEIVLRASSTRQENVELAKQFHRVVVDGASSTRIVTVLRLMGGVVTLDGLAGVLPDALEAHRRLIPSIGSAVRAGDADAAGRCYGDLLCLIEEAVVDELSGRGLLASSSSRERLGATQ
jgi:DNA-binding GntR family transcriptional regulator